MSKDPMRGTLRTAPAEAPLYLALKTSVIDSHVVPKGATVRYRGLPGIFLQPVDAAAKAVVAKVRSIRNGEFLSKEQGALGNEDRIRAIEAEGLRYSNELLGVTPVGEYGDEDYPQQRGAPNRDIEDPELVKQAEATYEQNEAQDREAGKVMLQLTGQQSGTVIPTTGPLSEATDQQKKATSEALKSAK